MRRLGMSRPPVFQHGPKDWKHVDDFTVTDTEQARQFDPVALAEREEKTVAENFQGLPRDERIATNVETRAGDIDTLPVDLFLTSMNTLRLGTDSLGEKLDQLALLLAGQLDDMYKSRAWEEGWFPMSQAVEYEVDYKQRRYLYAYTPVALTLSGNDGSTIILSQGWNMLVFRRGLKLTAPSVSASTPIFVLIRATDELLSVQVESSTGNPVNVVTQSSSAALSSVPGQLAAIQLSAANPNRKGWTVFNDSTATLFLGTVAVASLSNTNYTVQVSPGGFYELTPIYTGVISGLWSVAAGNARITDFS